MDYGLRTTDSQQSTIHKQRSVSIRHIATDNQQPGVPADSRLRTADCRLKTSASAFTLIELLVVIAIIVIMLALAVPAFNYLTGSRSIDAAQNTLGAMLGRARAEAIGLQETRGVMFFADAGSGRISAALVRQTTAPVGNASLAGDFIHDFVAGAGDDIDVYLDLVSDAEFVPLPPGISIQTVDDCSFTGTLRATDGYIGFNTLGRRGTSDTVLGADVISGPKIGGVLLFDGAGKLTSVRYAFRTRSMTAGAIATEMGKFLFDGTGNAPEGTADFIPVTRLTAASFQPVRSSFGFVLFDNAAFSSQGYTLNDPQIETPPSPGSYIAGTPTERDEETWIDQNASAVLINRYNGTLLRTE